MQNIIACIHGLVSHRLPFIVSLACVLPLGAFAQFDTVLNIPADQPELPSNSVVGSSTQVNLSTGGLINSYAHFGKPDRSSFHVEVNISGGIVDIAQVNRGAVVNMSGGVFTEMRVGNEAAVNIAGGQVAELITAYFSPARAWSRDWSINLSGGEVFAPSGMGRGVSPEDAGTLVITGGTLDMRSTSFLGTHYATAKAKDLTLDGGMVYGLLEVTGPGASGTVISGMVKGHILANEGASLKIIGGTFDSGEFNTGGDLNVVQRGEVGYGSRIDFTGGNLRAGKFLVSTRPMEAGETISGLVVTGGEFSVSNIALSSTAEADASRLPGMMLHDGVVRFKEMLGGYFLMTGGEIAELPTGQRVEIRNHGFRMTGGVISGPVWFRLDRPQHQDAIILEGGTITDGATFELWGEPSAGPGYISVAGTDIRKVYSRDLVKLSAGSIGDHSGFERGIDITGGILGDDADIYGPMTMTKGGSIGDRVVLRNSAVISGGQIGDDLKVIGSLDLIAKRLFIDGEEFTQDLLPDEVRTLDQRGVLLSGFFADGSVFYIDLDEQHIGRDATVRVALVPEPSSAAAVGILILLTTLRRKGPAGNRTS